MSEEVQEMTAEDLKAEFLDGIDEKPLDAPLNEEEAAAAKEEREALEAKTGPAITIGEAEILPAPGTQWDENVVGIISKAATDWGVPKKNIAKAFEWYSKGGMRKIPFSRGEGISIMEHLYGDAAPALIDLARSKVALLDSPELTELMNQEEVGNDPFLVATLANMAIPSQRRMPEPELTDLPTDPKAAGAELDTIKAPGSPYWNDKDHRHDEIVRRARALYEIVYSGK